MRVSFFARAAVFVAAVGAVVLSAGCPPGRTSKTRSKGASGHGKQVAVFNVSGELSELETMSDLFGPTKLILHRLLRNLRKARQDPAIGTVVVRVGSLTAGWAQLAELRQAMARVRKAGKTVVAFLDNPGNGAYYLATAAGKIYLSPGSSLWILGLNAQVTFIKGLLGKLGIEADFVQMGRYKGAAEPLTRDSLSPALREALNALLDSLHKEFIRAASKARNIKPDEVQKWVDRAPLSAKNAVSGKLVDGIVSCRQHVLKLAGKARIHWKYGKKKKKKSAWKGILELLQPGRGAPAPKEPHVALIYAVGPIVYGSGSDSLFEDEKVVASRKMEKLLRKLAKKKKVKAVVLRIDSPGGSALASDVIWLALRRLARIKPVVVSMGNVAASGGYYIASAADRIFAQPSTLTGSIGVIGGKFSLAGLFKKIGVTQEVLKRGARSDIFTLGRKFTPEERAHVKALMRDIYEQFVKRVSKGRRMGGGQVKAAAEGRVWSGADAARRRLVDKVGGLVDAVVEARRLGKLPDDAKVAIYPRPKSILGMLQEKLSERDVSMGLALAAVWPTGGAPRALAARLRVLSAMDPRLAGNLRQLVYGSLLWHKEHVLTMMPFVVNIR